MKTSNVDEFTDYPANSAPADPVAMPPDDAIRTYSNVVYRGEPHEEATCIVCASTTAGSSNSRVIPYWRLSGYRFVRCMRCGHTYQNPRPTQRALDDRYAADYFRYELENADRFFQLMMQGIADSRVMQRLAPDQPRTLLDIGCATGMLLAHYQRQGWEVCGIELCRPAAEYARTQRGVPVLDTDYAAAPLPAAHYGLVHSTHVIEHLPDPFHFLQYIARILHPAGYAIIVTPNICSLQTAIMRRRWRSAIADHLHLFSVRTLTTLCRCAGLQVVRTCSWGGLAAGIAPPLIKRSLDTIAKALNIGDVMLLLLRHAPTSPR